MRCVRKRRRNKGEWEGVEKEEKREEGNEDTEGSINSFHQESM